MDAASLKATAVDFLNTKSHKAANEALRMLSGRWKPSRPLSVLEIFQCNQSKRQTFMLEVKRYLCLDAVVRAMLGIFAEDKQQQSIAAPDHLVLTRESKQGVLVGGMVECTLSTSAPLSIVHDSMSFCAEGDGVTFYVTETYINNKYRCLAAFEGEPQHETQLDFPVLYMRYTKSLVRAVLGIYALHVKI